MALKNWRKTGKYSWRSRYYGSSGSHNFTGLDVQKNEVIISMEGNVNKILSVKKFKNKVLAYIWAKQYMRTH